MPITALNNLTEEELQALDDAVVREKERRRVSKIKKAAEMFDTALKYCEENHLSIKVRFFYPITLDHLELFLSLYVN